ncbi:(Fe-S)-binding protein, partial [Burkholderia semiarida]|uniref:(Fe-S)-binding protein n=1 Tax=Burkholderia semiarida TaxID=2843303 RepID=UPI0023DDBE70
NVARGVMMGVGYKVQRFANDMLKKVVTKQTQHPPATTGKPPAVEQVIHFVNKKMPGNLPKKTARALLDIEDNKIVPIIRNPKSTTVDSEAVFYFPGCGSERLFSQVGLATQAMLWEAGVQTVLPPGQRRARRDDGGGLQGAALRERHAQEGRDEADAAPAGDDGQAAGGRAGDPLREQEDAGQPAEEDGARAAGHRGQQD